MAAYWDNRTIKAKLFLGIGAILLMFAVSSGLVLSFVSTLAGSSERALNRITPLRTAALSTQYRLIDADDNSGYYVMDRNPANWAAYQRSVAADIAAVRDALPQLQDGADSAHERQTLAALSTWFDSYVKADEHSFSLKRAGRYDAAVKDFVTFDTSKGQGLIADFVSSTANRTSIATAEVQASSRAAVIACIAGALGAILAGAAIALLLGGSISRRLTLVSQAMDDVVREDFASLMAAMQRFAAGDLSARASTNRTRLAVRGRDESALLARSYNSLVDGITAFGAELSTTGDVLNAMIGDVKQSVDAAANGNFDRRLNVADRQGVFAELTQNVNRLMNVCEVGLREVARVLGALAHGDLTQTISADYSGTFGQLKDDSNATVGSLTRTVSEIKTAADVVSTSAREISAGNGDLSQRTEEQAASLEETAASMEELTATVNANAENAKQANVLAIGASDIAVKGGQVVGEVVQTMTAINDSGKKIFEIISVIDGIAFQTNILALNAAVEAARAGEQGRGFAVVAGEVRTLAQRSAAAAKEIKALIGDSVEKTTMGTRLVAVAGETMTEIVASVKRVNDIMSAIAAASVEQGAGIGQVNEAVAQMDKVTQQNAALVEQIAASAEALEERARGLVEVIGAFTLAPTTGIPARRQAPEVRVKTHSAAAPRSKATSAATAVATLPAADETDWSSF